MIRFQLLIPIAVFICFGWQITPSFENKLGAAAISLTHDKVIYDPAYFTIPYPLGDVPTGKGVCTDVVIRAYRKVGIDLQQKVHEDMEKHFTDYPKIWKLKNTDSNIDHRRVPNLMTFFSRFGTSKPLTKNPLDYVEGDIVCWNLGGAITHIGIVVFPSSGIKKPLIVHNIGSGQVLSNCLFDYEIIGHYAYSSH